jgi:hypothetical protein
LARKACRHTPIVAAAQNILMKKLCIIGAQQLATEDFKKYLKIFKEGLSVEQVKMIQDLFGEHEPHVESIDGGME